MLSLSLAWKIVNRKILKNMNEMPKIPYSPSQEKRFEVSVDEYSRERLKVAELFYDKMKQLFDVSMGLVLFGSLVKGKTLNNETKESADIDLTLFVDLDEYQDKYIENLRKNRDFFDFELRRLDDSYHNALSKKLMYESFDDIKNGRDISLNEKECIEKEFHIHSRNKFLFMLAVWHGYITDSSHEIMSNTFSFRGKHDGSIERINHLLTLKDVQVWPVQFHGEFSVLNQVGTIKNLTREDSTTKTERDIYVLEQEKMGIARIFGLDVGGGMKPYRQAFIRDLLSLNSTDGETLWNIVNDAVRSCERNNNISKNIERQFPKTLQEAVTYYRV
jgi:hypothetical protein